MALALAARNFSWFILIQPERTLRFIPSHRRKGKYVLSLGHAQSTTGEPRKGWRLHGHHCRPTEIIDMMMSFLVLIVVFISEMLLGTFQ